MTVADVREAVDLIKENESEARAETTLQGELGLLSAARAAFSTCASTANSTLSELNAADLFTLGGGSLESQVQTLVQTDLEGLMATIEGASGAAQKGDLSRLSRVCTQGSSLLSQRIAELETAINDAQAGD